MTTIVLGSQFGDEGKGKLVDILCASAKICARCAGGNNAGHTIVANGVTYDFHILPSGLVNPKCINFIGEGVVVHIPSFFMELEILQQKGLNTEGRIFISDRAHIVFDLHQLVDGLEEVELGTKAVGTTKKGIGPCYSTKAARTGIQMGEIFREESFERRLRNMASSYQKRYGDLLKYSVDEEIKKFDEYRQLLRPFVRDGVVFMHEAQQRPDPGILVEGANALMLDISYGTYPYVTSSNTSLGGVSTGLAINFRRHLPEVIGVVKAYTTRVGAGPLPTELNDPVGEELQSRGREFGVTTGRKRRTGWLDLQLVKYSVMVNCYTALNLTKIDVLDSFREIKVAVGYKIDGELIDSFPADLELLNRAEVEYETLQGWNTTTTGTTQWEKLPENAKKYVEFIENFLGGEIKCKYIGTGPDREHMIVR